MAADSAAEAEAFKWAESMLKYLSDESAVAPIRKKRRPSGLAKGTFVVPEDFDEPLPKDVLESFEND